MLATYLKEYTTFDMDYKQRLKILQQALVDQQLSAFYIVNHLNVLYLTGYTGTAATLLVTPRRALILTDARYLFWCREYLPWVTTVDASRGFQKVFDRFLKGSTRLGFEGHHLSVARQKLLQKQWPVELVSTSGLVEQLRQQKSRDEIRLMRRGAQLTDDLFLFARRLLRKMWQDKQFAQERELSWRLEQYARDHGAEKMAFDAIIASSKNAARPHHQTGYQMIKANQLLILDFGVVVDGYHTDMTRTVFFGDKPTVKHRAVYEHVREAQARAIKDLRIGMTGGQADALARDYFKGHSLQKYFTHSLGHGVGLEIHEAPTLSAKSQDILRDGQVVTIEPGLYYEGWGGVRIEDMGVMRGGRWQNLYKAPSDWKSMVIGNR